MPNLMIDEEMLWEVVQRHDRLYDGTFFFGVMTTGVFCRPSCPGRMPLRKNVQFFLRAQDAVSAGLRPCLRRAV